MCDRTQTPRPSFSGNSSAISFSFAMRTVVFPLPGHARMSLLSQLFITLRASSAKRQPFGNNSFSIGAKSVISSIMVHFTPQFQQHALLLIQDRKDKGLFLFLLPMPLVWLRQYESDKNLNQTYTPWVRGYHLLLQKLSQ